MEIEASRAAGAIEPRAQVGTSLVPNPHGLRSTAPSTGSPGPVAVVGSSGAFRGVRPGSSPTSGRDATTVTDGGAATGADGRGRGSSGGSSPAIGRASGATGQRKTGREQARAATRPTPAIDPRQSESRPAGCRPGA